MLTIKIVPLRGRGGDTRARRVTPRAEEALATRTSYFLGNDPSKWHVGVPSFAQVTYPSVLAGVDLVFHGSDGQLEYDIVVIGLEGAPDARPNRMTKDTASAQYSSFALATSCAAGTVAC